MLGETHGLKKFLSKDFTGMNRGKISHGYTLIVVDEFDMLSGVVMVSYCNHLINSNI